MTRRRTAIIVTLGPSTSTPRDIQRLKDKGIDFVRVNMSHSTIEDLRRFVGLATAAGLTFIIDTEGSQVRTGAFRDGSVHLTRDALVKIQSEPIAGDTSTFTLRPEGIVEQLSVGDLIHVDFESSILRVVDDRTRDDGVVLVRAITSGSIASNKAVVIDAHDGRLFHLPALSARDHQAIEFGVSEGIDHLLVSFVRSGEAVDEVRQTVGPSMRIMSKVECVDALRDLDAIVEKSDALLLDRGDLSKEIPMEKIPFVQRILIDKANAAQKPVFVATNLLETMVVKERPTRAEIQDVISTVVGGAAGLTLAAETAIGSHPMECVNVLNRVIGHAESIMDRAPVIQERDPIARALDDTDYLHDHSSSLLISPHGGSLIDRFLTETPAAEYLESLPRLRLTAEQHLDAEMIALGVYSPLGGFMGHEDFRSVLDRSRLASGVVWPVPVMLPADPAQVDGWSSGDVIGLTNGDGQVVALLDVEELFELDGDEIEELVNIGGLETGTGARPIMVAGRVDLLQPRATSSRAYELTPRQLRRLFDERGWATVLALQTDILTDPTRGTLPLGELGLDRCDGLLLHQSVGPDGSTELENRLNEVENNVRPFYRSDQTVAGAFPSSGRFPDHLEALRYAICAKNYGCSHIAVSNGAESLDEGPASKKPHLADVADIGVVLATL